jgi:hypothetical protein
MSEWGDLQQQVQQEATEENQHNSNKKRKDSLDGEEVMVDVINRDEVDKDPPVMEESVDIFDALQLDDSLFEVIEDLNEDLIPPMFNAIQIGQQFLDPNMVFRALAEGDQMSIKEMKDTLFDIAEAGVFPREEGLMKRFSMALEKGIEGLENGEAISEILPYEVKEIKATVDSSLIASNAMHSEVWEEDEETILAFQNLSKEEADEVQDDFSDLDDDKISSSDKAMIEDSNITAIEIEEKVVDWLEMAHEDEYEVLEEDDLDEG